MYIDHLTTAALADLLRAEIVGARVQDVLQLERLTVAFELYRGARQYLTLSADAAAEGVRLTDVRPRRGETAPGPLALALAARTEGSSVAAVDQPPFDRILRIDFGTDPPLRLVAELTGRLANLVLVEMGASTAHGAGPGDGDRGTIVALARPVPPGMTRARVLLPGRPYRLPPPPSKVDFDALAAADLAGRLRDRPDDPAAHVLLHAVRGMSPLAAREIVARAGAPPDAPARAVDPEALKSALDDLFLLPVRGGWAPSIARDAADPDRIAAYAPYRLTHLPNVADAPTIAAAIEAFEAARVGGDRYRVARAGVAALIDEAQGRLARQRAALEREWKSDDDIAHLKLAGDMILAFQHTIRPGQAVLDAPLDPDAPLRIALDPALTAVENAGRYFHRFRRARRAAEALPERIARVDAARATLAQLATDLALAEDRPAIDAVHEALRVGGLVGRPLPRRVGGGPAVGRPLEVVSGDGFTIVVGRNSRQNELVTFQRAARGDLWLHAHGVPGAHVIVKAAGRQVPEATVLEAAALAAWFSGARDGGHVDVAVTDARHVRRLKDGGPGMVTYEHGRTVTVAPAAP